MSVQADFQAKLDVTYAMLTLGNSYKSETWDNKMNQISTWFIDFCSFICFPWDDHSSFMMHKT